MMNIFSLSNQKKKKPTVKVKAALLSHAIKVKIDTTAVLLPNYRL